mmetsp:Transcript_136479/g.340314  ORF Transcript_136479/g.340314 Transcript_136479/m.340314 type:complete len:231 (+) Transcript_136479:4268-4960(+)
MEPQQRQSMLLAKRLDRPFLAGLVGGPVLCLKLDILRIVRDRRQLGRGLQGGRRGEGRHGPQKIATAFLEELLQFSLVLWQNRQLLRLNLLLLWDLFAGCFQLLPASLLFYVLGSQKRQPPSLQLVLLHGQEKQAPRHHVREWVRLHWRQRLRRRLLGVASLLALAAFLLLLATALDTREHVVRVDPILVEAAPEAVAVPERVAPTQRSGPHQRNGPGVLDPVVAQMELL